MDTCREESSELSAPESTATEPSSAESRPDIAEWWWTPIALNLAIFAATFLVTETSLDLPAWFAPVKFLVGPVVLTAPAVVAIAVHFDRRYVAAVSDWEPRSAYVLLGLAMWADIGILLAVLYLYRRHEYVGTP